MKGTTRKPKPITVAKATDRHPEQAQLIQEEVPHGYWETLKLSSAIPVPDRDAMLRRAEKLKIAVDQAKEVANQTPAPEPEEFGANLLSFVLGPAA